MTDAPTDLLLVTGHTRGLGASLVDEGLARGMTVVGIGRREVGGRADDRLHQVVADLADAHAAAAAVADALGRVAATGHRAVHLVANAGVLAPIRAAGALGAEAVARAVAVNVTAPIVMADALLHATASAPTERRILLVGSGAGRNAYAGWSVYCSTKAALDHFARSVALEAPDRLRIESVAPGVIDTDMQAEIRASDPAHFPQRPRFEAMADSGALAAPRDVAARLLAHLLDDAFGRQPVTDLRTI